MNWRMPVLPPSGSTTPSANSSASRLSPAGMPSAQPVCTASSTRSPAFARPAHSSCARMSCRCESASTLSMLRRPVSFQVFVSCSRAACARASRLASPVRYHSRTRACAADSTSPAAGLSSSTRPIAAARSPSTLRPLSNISSASRKPSAPRRSASNRGSRCVPPYPGSNRSRISG